MRKAFIECVKGELAADPALLVFLGDISVAGFLKPDDQLMDRVYNCGILEQAMMSFAAGTAMEGAYPVVQTIIPFIVERAFEQIKLDFCAQKNAGLIVGVGGGLEYSKLGYTHHTLWDTALLANLEGLTLFTPTVGPAEVRDVLQTFMRTRELAYARLTHSYLTSGVSGPFRPRELVRLHGDRAGPLRCALVVCGSFPGMQRIVDGMQGDVFAYSFPLAVPTNLDLLRGYSAVEVCELSTMPLLTRTLATALPSVVVTGRYQRPGFFRSYGDAAAQRFIEANWIEA